MLSSCCICSHANMTSCHLLTLASQDITATNTKKLNCYFKALYLMFFNFGAQALTHSTLVHFCMVFIQAHPAYPILS